MTRPFRFGVQAGQGRHAHKWDELSREVEDLGYATLTVPDHFGDLMGPFAAMTAAAAASGRLRVGTLVLDHDFWHPVVLAREAATVDVLSGGRLELGIGAGWMQTDYEQSGIRHDPAGTRIARLAESVGIVKGLFDEGAVDFDGDHYTVRGLDPTPKPTQRPRPPIVLGGGGERMLRLAGREADVVSLNLDLRSGDIPPDLVDQVSAEATERKVGWVREAAGDRFGDLELNVLVYAVVVTDDRQGTAEGMAAQMGGTPEALLATPHFLVGTVEQIAEDLVEQRERFGISYYVLQSGFRDFAPVVERLAGA